MLTSGWITLYENNVAMYNIHLYLQITKDGYKIIYAPQQLESSRNPAVALHQL